MAGKIRHQTERIKARGKERQWPATADTKRSCHSHGPTAAWQPHQQNLPWQ